MRSVYWNPWNVFAEVWCHRYLLGQLIKRDVLLRYRGAMFGVLWIFLSPLLMLAIFAFIFGQIFQARWPQQSDAIPFWLLLYAGLIAFNIFADTVTRAPSAVRSYPSFVKKIVFPVVILPLVPLGAALVHATFNLLILLVVLAWLGKLQPSILWVPLLLTPVILLAVAVAWFVAAWGVFIKDMSQILPLFVQMLLFLSPVFYPVSVAPPALRLLYALNPIGITIEATRDAITGHAVSWGGWAVAFIVSLLATWLGHAYFQHSREEFADAL